MNLHEITAAAGANKRRKRVGRGESSGHGRTSGRGNKGCQSRTGGGPPFLHEGGAVPLVRRMPKRGFNNYNFRDEYEVVNVGDLESEFDSGATVDSDALRKLRLTQGRHPLLKILGTGELKKKLNVVAHAFSASAKEAIEKAGGSVKLIERADVAAIWKSRRNTVKNAAKKGDGKAGKKKSAKSES